MNNADVIAKSGQYFMNTYTRFPAVMVEGRGCMLKDADGRECDQGYLRPGLQAGACI